jgi:hypothetical protein
LEFVLYLLIHGICDAADLLVTDMSGGIDEADALNKIHCEPPSRCWNALIKPCCPRMLL